MVRVDAGAPRKRSARTCIACREKKIKCDGKQPCYQCLGRAQPDACAYRDRRDTADKITSLGSKRTLTEKEKEKSVSHSGKIFSESGMIMVESFRSSDTSPSQDVHVASPRAQSSSILMELLQSLPPAEELKRLFEIYMVDLKKTCYPIAKATFTRYIDGLDAIKARKASHTSDLSSLAVIYGILGLAEQQNSKPSSIQSRGMIFTLLISSLDALNRLGIYDVSRCIAEHLCSRLYLLTLRPLQAWQAASSAAKLAHFLRLYEGIASSKEEGYLLWNSLVYEERTLSLMMEQPSTDYGSLNCKFLPTPSDTISFEMAAIVAWRQALSDLVSRAASLCSMASDSKHGLSHSMDLAKQIEDFRQRLPSDDLHQHFAFVPRFMIHSHALQARLTLLRRYLLSAKPQSEQDEEALQRARVECVEAANVDLRLREEFVSQYPIVFSAEETPSHIDSYVRTPRWFNSLVICGTYLLTEMKRCDGQIPTSAFAGTLIEHFHVFLSLCEKHLAKHGSDHVLEQEVRVVKSFLERTDFRLSASPGNLDMQPTSAGRQALSPTHHQDHPHIEQTTVTNAQPLEDSDVQSIFDAWFSSDNANFGGSSMVFQDGSSTVSLPSGESTQQSWQIFFDSLQFA